MSLATSQLIERASLLRQQVRSTLTYPSPTDIEAHERARLLRSSICLASFTAIEDFLKSRFAELVAELSRSHAGFAQFPLALQEALTIGALRNASWMLDPDRRSRLPNPVAFAQVAGANLASTRGGALNPYADAFSPNSYNMSWSVVEGLGNSLLIESHQNAYAGLAFTLAGGPFVPKDYLAVALKRRNEVAHVPWFDVAHGDLMQQVDDMTKFCCVIDMLFSFGVKRIVAGDPEAIRKQTFNYRVVKIRWLERLGADVREIRAGSARAHKRHASLGAAELDAKPRCIPTREALVVRSGVIIEGWSTPYL